ncbi:MAG: DUF615 domain-containing protein [Succinivibrio sp.]|nr:DUF615 domain-containing protein [Succinivibrio sp.]
MIEESEQFFSGFDEEPEEFSRSALKRQAQALRSLIEKVADLGEQGFAAIELPQEVRAALEEARRLRKNSDERRRQLQYAAKLQRGYPDFDLQGAYDAVGATSGEDPRVWRLERLRQAMLDGGTEVLNGWCALVPDTDRNKLRALIKKARAESEKESGTPRPATRELYRYLKSELQRAAVEIPAELLRGGPQAADSV